VQLIYMGVQHSETLWEHRDTLCNKKRLLGFLLRQGIRIG